jgi:hypothetical protein
VLVVNVVRAPSLLCLAFSVLDTRLVCPHHCFYALYENHRRRRLSCLENHRDKSVFWRVSARSFFDLPRLESVFTRELIRPFSESVYQWRCGLFRGRCMPGKSARVRVRNILSLCSASTVVGFRRAYCTSTSCLLFQLAEIGGGANCSARYACVVS